MVQAALLNGHACPECRKTMRYGEAFHVDHIVPVVHGGTNDPSNLRITHAQCNLRRGTRSPNAQREPDPLVPNYSGSRKW